MKYKIISYLLQDGRWGCSFTEPPIVDSQSVTLSEPVELGEYFQTKEEADNNTLNFLKNQGVKKEDIEI